MKSGITFTRRMLGRACIAGVAALFVSTVGLADDASKDLDDAAKYMNKGYAEIGKVVNKLDEDKEKSAMRHFNKAMADFNKAVEYYAKATLPPEDQPAIEALKQGLDALDKCVKALEKNNQSEAQQEYDAAQNYFAEAASLLD
jgi:uncharacterized protein YukE